MPSEEERADLLNRRWRRLLVLMAALDDPPEIGSRWQTHRGRRFSVTGQPFDPGEGEAVRVPVCWDDPFDGRGAKGSPSITLARFYSGTGADLVERIEGGRLGRHRFDEEEE